MILYLGVLWLQQVADQYKNMMTSIGAACNFDKPHCSRKPNYDFGGNFGPCPSAKDKCGGSSGGNCMSGSMGGGGRSAGGANSGGPRMSGGGIGGNIYANAFVTHGHGSPRREMGYSSSGSSSCSLCNQAPYKYTTRRSNQPDSEDDF